MKLLSVFALVLSLLFYSCGKSDNSNSNTTETKTNNSTETKTDNTAETKTNNTTETKTDNTAENKTDKTTENKNQTTNTTPKKENIVTMEKAPSGKLKHEEPEPDSDPSSKASGIRVNFPAGATQVSMNGKINGFGQNIIYLFEVKAGQKLTASVRPQSGKGNIRISQIIAPSGKADGPFDNPMTYSLTEAGDWKLVLSENQMAGDPWAGEYVLTVEIR